MTRLSKMTKTLNIAGNNCLIHLSDMNTLNIVGSNHPLMKMNSLDNVGCNRCLIKRSQWLGKLELQGLMLRKTPLTSLVQENGAKSLT